LGADRQTGGYDEANDRFPQLFSKNLKITSVSILLELLSGSPNFTVGLSLGSVKSGIGLTEIYT
jgi:hypothetical protein